MKLLLTLTIFVISVGLFAKETTPEDRRCTIKIVTTRKSLEQHFRMFSTADKTKKECEKSAALFRINLYAPRILKKEVTMLWRK